MIKFSASLPLLTFFTLSMMCRLTPAAAMGADTTEKIYQRTVFVPIEDPKPANTTPWNNTEPYLKRNIMGLDYVKRSGNLESNLFRQNDGTPEGAPFPVEMINGFDLNYEMHISSKFIDTTKAHNLMYYNNFKGGYSFALHSYSFKDSFAIDPITVGYLNMGINFDYSRGYGWTFEDKASLSVYKTLGFSIGIFGLTNAYSSDPQTGFGDYTETGFRYQINKHIGVVTALRENSTYNNLSFDKWALGKIVELGGHAALDKLVTPYFINRKSQWTPIYQLVYQSLWSYTIYALRQKNTYFPFSNNSDETLIQDTRFLIGIKISVNSFY